MAKRQNKNQPGRKIIVNSKAYGRHERAARGTKTKADLNEAMKAHGARMIKSNMPARLIRNALMPYRSNFTGGMLWQELVKHFAEQAKTGAKYSVEGLEYTEVHKYYTSTRIMSTGIEVNPNRDSLLLEMTFNHVPVPLFLERVPYVNGFQVTMIAMFPDFDENEMTVSSGILPVRGLKENTPFAFLMDVPPGAKECLLCCKIEGSQNGVVSPGSSNVSKAMFFSHVLTFDPPF